MDFEPIVIIFVVIAAISALAKRAKIVTGTQQNSASQQRSEQPKAVRQPKPKAAPTAGTAQPTAYQPIQSRMIDPSQEGAYVGSLGGESTEGVDPCHDDEMARAYAMEAPAHEQTPPLGAIRDLMNRDALVKAVVMAEILTRPSQRKRGL